MISTRLWFLFLYPIIFFPSGLRLECAFTLDGVGPVDNRTPSGGPPLTSSTPLSFFFYFIFFFLNKWHVTCDPWHMTRHMWHMTRHMWHMVVWTFPQNLSSLALTVWTRQCFEDIFTRGQCLNQSINKSFNMAKVYVEQLWLHQFC